jgi:hypothetical protein
MSVEIKDPFVARKCSKMRQLAETRPALARLLEFWIDEAFSRG